MISPEMIHQILLQTDWGENKISKSILVPCLNAFSVRNALKLRDVRFVGGTTEQGNDIEYYELFGPDLLRFYTGIQVKKGDIGQADAGKLIRQGGEAFDKEINDASSGTQYRINRWVVAATGGITAPARQNIAQQLTRYAKPIHFWDGLQLSTMLMEYWYREFVETIGIDSRLAASSNVRMMYFDPDEPQVLHPAFSETTFASIDISHAKPPTQGGILLTVRPLDKNIPSTQLIVRSSVDEITVDSLLSQLQPYLLRTNENQEIEALVTDSSRPVQILARGYFDIL